MLSPIKPRIKSQNSAKKSGKPECVFCWMMSYKSYPTPQKTYFTFQLIFVILYIMPAYKKERLENTLLFFAQEHYKKTKKHPSQTVLYKYLAFFEFRYLEKTGIMPLELKYRAMKNGPVPIEIYDKRNQKGAFSTVDFESFESQSGYSGLIVKPKGKFNPDYFAEAELKEMKNLIEMFAQTWVGANIMSDASHEAILAWKKTFKKQENAIIDPIDDFERDILSIPLGSLNSAEERFLTHRKITELVN